MTSLAPDFRGATLDRLRRSIAQALDLAALIEQGQAAMPLHDHFEKLDGSVETAPLTLTVLGLNATSRSAALSWFCGTEYRILSADMPATFGLVEVHLGARGYVLVNSGRRQEFDRLEPFLVAVRAADLLPHGVANAWREPMRLEVAAPRSLQGLKLLVPESVAALVENPTSMARARIESTLIVVAGPGDHELGGEDADALRHLAEGVVSWPVVVGPPSIQGDGESGWFRMLGSRTVPVACIESETSPPVLPAFLRDPSSSLRLALSLCQQATDFEISAALLEERIQQLVLQHDTRRKAIKRRLSSFVLDIGSDQIAREAADLARRNIEEYRTKIEAEVADTQRARLLPTSVASNRISNLLEDLGTDDLTEQASERIIQLRLSPARREIVNDLIRDLVRTDVRSDLERMNSRLELLAEKTFAEVERSLESRSTNVPEPMNEGALWSSIRESIHLESRYRGELLKKEGREKAIEFLRHCREPFAILGVIAPFYYYFSQLRAYILPTTPLLIAVGAYWAYHGLQEEKPKALEREVVRLRETLGAEIRRLYEQALADWNNRALQHIRAIVKVIGQQIDEHGKQRASQVGRETARECALWQEKDKVVDSRLRELNNAAQQAVRIRQAATEVRQNAERLMLDSLDDLRRSAKSP
jgi:hypothetical protein